MTKTDLLLTLVEEAAGAAGVDPELVMKERGPELVGLFINALVEVGRPAIRRDVPKMIEKRQRHLGAFRKRLRKTWKKPLDLLTSMIVGSVEAGAQYVRAHRDQELGPTGAALFRLHAAGCRASEEVLCLLEGGFASAANARWRSLHEIAVTALFVRQHGDELAQRYLDHYVVEQYKAAMGYQAKCKRLGQRPLRQRQLEYLKTNRDLVMKRHGEAFGQSYGWAAEVLENPRPKFDQIEEHVRLDHLRPYYKFASYPVHAGSFGLLYTVELGPEARDFLLAGPSNGGLADPGQFTAVSLLQLTLLRQF